MKSLVLYLLALVAIAQAQRWWDADGDGDGDGYFDGDGGFDGNDDGNGDGFGDSFQNGIGFDIQQAMSYRNIHGILAAVAFVALFPLGSIFMRVIPGRFAWIIHGITQMIAYIVYIAGAALGIYLVRMVQIPPNNSSLLEMEQTRAHPIIGLVVLAVLFLQPVLGWIHHIRFKALGRRTAWSYAHLFIGRTTITLGIINGGLGLQLAGASDSAITAYSIVAAIMWTLWVIAAAYGEVKKRRVVKKQPEYMNQPSPPYTVGPMYGDATYNEPRTYTPGSAVAGAETEMTTRKPKRSAGSVSLTSTEQTRRAAQH
ncbi:uncharacterized protein BCR38DRAFT_437282 [Pseudomassariella vexata]|uniref:Cytochrome b561 domain-containing protein n=1 Tax=Pseudomassariella vexata TaxID=1141098 RepID=A0A1Y2DTU5_9PEZI|nr:uncharacterized protein BCR38DRAFT_437282 [Pseudomassariella vexata]ORY62055.1 hypothetical protein BCR38DRAFT_437282 [Pseudomassariella vexata]